MNMTPIIFCLTLIAILLINPYVIKAYARRKEENELIDTSFVLANLLASKIIRGEGYLKVDKDSDNFVSNIIWRDRDLNRTILVSRHCEFYGFDIREKFKTKFTTKNNEIILSEQAEKILYDAIRNRQVREIKQSEVDKNTANEHAILDVITEILE